jgi:hypothetical protein
MALNYAKNALANGLGIPNQGVGNAPGGGALNEIRKYGEAGAVLLNALANTDANSTRNSSQRMLEVLAWMSMTVLRNALDRYPNASKIDPNGAWIPANNAVVLLAAAVTAAANLHQGGALPVNVGANVAVESALELTYESVLEGVAPANFGM